MTSVVATQFVPLVATAAAARDFMVVSLHDIAPCNRDVANEIISELSRHGVRVCSLLVVPDYHHQGLATKDRQFVGWLRDLESDGLPYRFRVSNSPDRMELLTDFSRLCDRAQKSSRCGNSA